MEILRHVAARCEFSDFLPVFGKISQNSARNFFFVAPFELFGRNFCLAYTRPPPPALVCVFVFVFMFSELRIPAGGAGTAAGDH